MTNLINGRTPEEIKRVLEWAKFACGDLVCEECPYYENVCSHESYEKIAPDALALIEHLEAKNPKWISVKERLPELGEWVVFRFLVGGNPEAVLYATGCYKEREYSSFGGFEWYTDDENYNCNLGHHEVTHWMPLPEPLKEEAK